MMFKVFTVLCASLAFAQAGLLAAAPAQLHYSPANEVSHVYNSIEAISHHQPLVAQETHVLAAPTVAKIATPIHAAPVTYHQAQVVPSLKAYAAPAHVYSAPITKQLTYSPAHEVSQVYSSIAAPQYAYGSHAPLTISSPTIGSTHQSISRSHGGTISHYSKAEDTAFSSVRKTDTRISNNVYTPALATKTVAIQQPAYLEQKSIPATVVSHVTFDGLGTHYGW